MMTEIRLAVKLGTLTNAVTTFPELPDPHPNENREFVGILERRIRTSGEFSVRERSAVSSSSSPLTYVVFTRAS